MWSWKIETIKSSLVFPNVCLKHCFNLFRFEKAQVAQDEHIIQLNSNMLSCYVAKGMSCLIPHWFDHKLKSLPCLWNESSLLFR